MIDNLCLIFCISCHHEHGAASGAFELRLLMHVTGAWTRLLSDWLDREHLSAPAIRARLARFAPDDDVALDDWRTLLEQAARLKPELTAPGLAIGAGVKPEHVGVLGYLVLASDTLGAAMVTYQRYERLFYGVNLAEVRRLGHDAELRWAPTQTGSIADETAIAALVSFLRRQIPDPPPPSGVGFVHTVSPEHARACDDFFGCAVEFSASHTYVRFPASYLALPMHRNGPWHDPGLRALLDRQAQALLAALPDPKAFDRAVQQWLLRRLPEGRIRVDDIARELHLSTRSLQRRLEDSDMTWQQLLDRTREQLARQYLRDRTLSLAEIALLLGYSEQSAFTRAFRRWTGITPRDVRKSVGS